MIFRACDSKRNFFDKLGKNGGIQFKKLPKLIEKRGKK